VQRQLHKVAGLNLVGTHFVSPSNSMIARLEEVSSFIFILLLESKSDIETRHDLVKLVEGALQ